jgi:hypothetical protein
VNALNELGYFGNIWVRQNYLEKIGDIHPGHKHNFDHISLLASGKVEVTVNGHEPKVFKAPTFIVIKKEHYHTFKALEDNTLWYCVFALRDINGDVTDIYSEDNSPYGVSSEDFKLNTNKIKSLSQEEK